MATGARVINIDPLFDQVEAIANISLGTGAGFSLRSHLRRVPGFAAEFVESSTLPVARIDKVASMAEREGECGRSGRSANN